MADDLVVKKCVLGGLNPLDPAYVACTEAGDLCPNDGYTFLHVKNAHNAVQNISIDSLQKCNQGEDHNAVSGDIAITAGELMIGPFDRGRFNNPAGKLIISYPKGVTTLTIAAISVRP